MSSSSGMPSPSMALPGRQKVTRACANCVKQRHKCDGQLPCSFCIKRNADCHFPDKIPRKRGPPKGHKATREGAPPSAADLLSENARLKAELAALRLQSAAFSKDHSSGVGEKRKRGSAQVLMSGVAAEADDLGVKKVKKSRLSRRPEEGGAIAEGDVSPTTAAEALAAISESSAAAGASRARSGTRSKHSSNSNSTVPLSEAASRSSSSSSSSSSAASSPVVVASIQSKPGGLSSKLLPSSSSSNTDIDMGGHSGSSMSLWSATASSVWDPPGPIIPSKEEMAVIAKFFETFNKVFPVVDEASYRAGLKEAATAADNAGGPAVKFGFRVLHYMVLCAGDLLTGKPHMAQHKYSLARAYLGPCFTQPSLHLVSALLIMVEVSRVFFGDMKPSAIHASLAIGMCDLVDIPPQIRLYAEILAASNTSPFVSMVMETSSPGVKPNFIALGGGGLGTTIQWPTPKGEVSADTPWYKRLAELATFIMLSLLTDFECVQPGNVDRFVAFLKETEALRVEHKVFLQTAGMSNGFLALLHHKFGDVDKMMTYARRAIADVLADSLSQYTFAAVMTAKLLPLLTAVASKPGPHQSAASVLSKQAHEWTKSSFIWQMITAPPLDVPSAAALSSSLSQDAEASFSNRKPRADVLGAAEGVGVVTVPSRAAVVGYGSSASEAPVFASPPPLHHGQVAPGAVKFDNKEVLRLSAALVPAIRGGEKPGSSSSSSSSSSSASAKFTVINGFKVPTGPGALLPLDETSSLISAPTAPSVGGGVGLHIAAPGARAGGEDDDDSILGTRAALKTAGEALQPGPPGLAITARPPLDAGNQSASAAVSIPGLEARLGSSSGSVTSSQGRAFSVADSDISSLIRAAFPSNIEFGATRPGALATVPAIAKPNRGSVAAPKIALPPPLSAAGATVSSATINQRDQMVDVVVRVPISSLSKMPPALQSSALRMSAAGTEKA